MARYMELTRLEVPGYEAAKSAEERLDAVHRYVLGVRDVMSVDLPAYRQATNYPDPDQRLLDWLSEQERYFLKPVNCPNHIQIYKANRRGYVDLSSPLAEFGTVTLLA